MTEGVLTLTCTGWSFVELGSCFPAVEIFQQQQKNNKQKNNNKNINANIYKEKKARSWLDVGSALYFCLLLLASWGCQTNVGPSGSDGKHARPVSKDASLL